MSEKSIRRKINMPKDGQPLPPATQLKVLPEDERKKVMVYIERHTLKSTIRWLASKCGIKNCTVDAVRSFRNWQLGQEDLEAINGSIERFEEIYKSVNPDATREKIREAGLAVFMAHATKANNRKAFLQVLAKDLAEKSMRTRASMEEKKLRLEERRVAILEKKAAQADEAAAVVKSQLTPKEKQRRLDIIFA